MRFNIDR
jgi:hypothetical protein